MKKIKGLLLVLGLVMLTGLTGCKSLYDGNIAKLMITNSQRTILIQEEVVITYQALNKEYEVIDVADELLVLSVPEKDSPRVVIDGLKIVFNQPGHYTVSLSFNLSQNKVSTSAKFIAQSPSSPIASMNQNSSNSAELIHITFDFTLRRNFTFDDYAFSSESEYIQAYNDLFNGNELEKDEAVMKIGNDIIVRIYYINDNNETVPLTLKTKAWSQYLNTYTTNASEVTRVGEVDVPYSTGGYTLAASGLTYTTSTNYSDSQMLITLNGKRVYIDLVVIENGKIYSKTEHYDVRNISPIMNFRQSSSNSAENIHITFDFNLARNFTFDAYNFATEDEYAQVYNNLFNGSESEKAEAVTKVGNDIIVRIYYINDSGEIVQLTLKTKAWSQYLNTYTTNAYEVTRVGEANVAYSTGGYTLAASGLTYTTSNNYSSSQMLATLNGKRIYIDLVVIENGKIYSETEHYDVRNISPIANFRQSSSNSATNIHITFAFNLTRNFTFDAYNFSNENEYAQIYNNLFNGSQSEKAEAVAKIGNDIIVRIYYINDSSEVVQLTLKTKAWSQYLNTYTTNASEITKVGNTDVEYCTGGYTLAASGLTYATATNYSSSQMLTELNGKKVYINLVVIESGNIYSETTSYQLRTL